MRGIRMVRDMVTVAALLFMPWLAHAALPGPLERPAQMAAHPDGAVMLAVTTVASRVVAVGERGIVVFSDDNGRSWRQASVPVSVSLTAVQFVDAREGWATGHGGVLLHTQDGGETWSKTLDGVALAQLLLSTAQAGQKAAQGDEDEGARQVKAAQLMVSDGPDKPFFDVYFSDKNNGYIVGAYNLILRTQDGGKSWQPWQSHIDNSGNLHLYAIRGVGSRLYIVGEQGSVFRSDNGGEDFEAVQTPYEGSYFNVFVDDTNNLLVSGLRGNAFRSDDNGNDWSKVELPSGASVTGSTRLRDGRLVLVNQSGQLLLSQDQGGSFDVSPLRQLPPLSGITQSADDSLIVVGMRGVSRISLSSVTGSQK
ncbi:WD40/YVTN/BNR-like repeat-containing protein [Pseudomonas sp. NPDC090208]|uniref:WD40/YVTN/BNR-like repeat-containing protein n=1 Tax=Pseudomonas sp. NPDC090208 TaxID=3364478 RepID=UPI00382275DD